MAHAAPPPAVRDESDPTWSRATLRAARVAVWGLPAFAAALLWAGLTPRPDPAADPAEWAGQVTEPGYLATRLAVGPGIAMLGLVAVLALVTLLAGARGRGFAIAGLVAGLAAAVLWLPRDGVLAFTAPALVEASASQAVAADTYTGVLARAGEVALVGAGLFTLSLMLLGVAVWRCRGLNRADGVLLVLAAPLLGIAGWHVDLLLPLGALLLLAAGVGIAWNGGRAAQSWAWPSTSPTPTTYGSPTTGR